MEKNSMWSGAGKSRNMFIIIAVVPLLALIFMVILFVYGELQGIRSTYHIEEGDIDSPYSIFDKVLLLNSYTRYDFLELQDKVENEPEVFLQREYLEAENENLREKYSFLAVTVNDEITYFGEPDRLEQIREGVLMEGDSISEENAHYYAKGKTRYLFKKLSIAFPDGRSGSVCIVTDLDVNLPHITIFTIGLVVMVIVISVLVIIAIIGYAYYNIVIPIRNLQMAVIHISEGDMDYEIKAQGENEFTELYEELDSMRLTLKETIGERDQADALTKEVVGNISHDLKTPLTAIKGYAEGILDGVAATPERIEKYVRTIHAKSIDMAGLVDELSYFTKIYQREETFTFSEVNVVRYFGECVSDMALDLETREIQLLYQCYVNEVTKVTLDADKIKRVIANIIGNAVKYIDHRHGIILISISESEKEITVMIRDNGKGIEKDELPFIFDRFYRTDSSRNSKTGGSGLGLAIARKIMDEHDGKIWAESEVDQGTAIYFSLPK
ncbi:MAG: HAMP domain-containing histidine kinase [Roseburia sp.]|nr:HAMP domain-containing histidine kinase [Roseburia sp.]